MVLRTLRGTYLRGDHREGGLGDIQKVEDEDRDDADDEVEDADRDGKENEEGAVSGLGDFSTNGSLCGELKSRHTVDSRKPMLEAVVSAVFDQ